MREGEEGAGVGWTEVRERCVVKGTVHEQRELVQSYRGTRLQNSGKYHFTMSLRENSSDVVQDALTDGFLVTNPAATLPCRNSASLPDRHLTG